MLLAQTDSGVMFFDCFLLPNVQLNIMTTTHQERLPVDSVSHRQDSHLKAASETKQGTVSQTVK